MADVGFRPARPGEEPAIAELARRVFDEFVAPAYSEEGRATYHRFADPDALVARAAENARWVAEADGRLVGMLEVRGGTHVAMLFVEGARQGRGIGRRLLETAFGPLSRWPALTVNSAPDAVGMYRRLGFVPTSDEREELGMRFLPMRREAGADAGR